METNRIATLDPTPPTSSVPSVPSPAAAPSPHGGSRFNIGHDIIETTAAALTAPLAETLRRGARFCRTRNLSCTEFGALLRKRNGEAYSGDSVYQAFTGRRDPETLRQLCSAIDDYLAEVEASLPKSKHPFVRTTTVRRIWNLCDACYDEKSVGFIIGSTQTGKSTALAYYQSDHNHGRTHLVRMPTRGSLCDLTYRMSAQLGIPRSVRMQDLRTRIFKCFSPGVMLIIDEAHQCCLGTYGDRALITVEWLRELADTTGAPLIICGTDVLKHTLQSSPILAQLWQRRSHLLQLPKTPPPTDIIALEKSFGLSPAPNRTLAIETVDPDGNTITLQQNPMRLRDQVLSRDSFGHWAKILQSAAAAASASGADLTWGRVIDAHHQLDEQ